MRQTLLSLLLLAAAALPGWAGEFVLLTVESPGLVAIKNGRPEGPGVEVIGELQRRAGTAMKLAPVSWLDGLKQLAETPERAMFPMAGDYGMRKKFVFVGPVAEMEYCFFAAKDGEAAPATLEEAKAHRIGVLQNGICHQFLLGLGFGNLFVAEGADRLLPMLLEGNFDLLLAGKDEVRRAAAAANVAPDKYREVLVAFTSALHVGFNQQADAAVVEKWKKALADMAADGTLEKLLRGGAKAPAPVADVLPVDDPGKDASAAPAGDKAAPPAPAQPAPGK